MSRANAAQDFLPASKSSPDLHFDNEQLLQGRTRLVGALRESLEAAKALEYTLARQRLGAALHALQVTLGLLTCLPYSGRMEHSPPKLEALLCSTRSGYKEGKGRGKPGRWGC